MPGKNHAANPAADETSPNTGSNSPARPAGKKSSSPKTAEAKKAASRPDGEKRKPGRPRKNPETEQTALPLQNSADNNALSAIAHMPPADAPAPEKLNAPQSEGKTEKKAASKKTVAKKTDAETSRPGKSKRAAPAENAGKAAPAKAGSAGRPKKAKTPEARAALPLPLNVTATPEAPGATAITETRQTEMRPAQVYPELALTPSGSPADAPMNSQTEPQAVSRPDAAPLAEARKSAKPARGEGKAQKPGKHQTAKSARPKSGAAQARPETLSETPIPVDDTVDAAADDFTESGENGEDGDQKKSSRTRRNRARRNRRKAKAQAEKARQAEAARANASEDDAPDAETALPNPPAKKPQAQSAGGRADRNARKGHGRKDYPGGDDAASGPASLDAKDDKDDKDDFFISGFEFEEDDAEDFRFFVEEDDIDGPDDLAADLSDDAPNDYDEEEDGGAPALPAKNGRKRGKGGKNAVVETEKHTAKRKMFLSVLPGEQLEVVLAEEGQVQEYYVEMLHQSKIKGNIYKGVIHNVDANLQAAFVSYGASKNGFLQIDEVHQEYYQGAHQPEKGRKYPPIQQVLKPGQEILVQVVKEPAGTKGAFLTTYLSLAGRFLVLTPGREQIGVSRKVENEEERARLRELLNGLTPGPGLGVIVRTVSMGASKTALQRDLQYLKRLWRDIRKKGTSEAGPCLLHEEADLTTRAVRDYLTEDILEVWVDEQETCNQLAEVVGLLFPRRQNMVQLHKDPAQSLFARFSLQKQLDQVHSREVGLPSGGRLVIDHTEALTAIDINSGRSSGKQNFEDMAYRINMEAAQAIPLQLRLRDIGGQVVVDFIEMRDRSHWREVERTFRNAMKVDRARHDVGRISSFGLLEVVRQRLGSSAISISTELCPACRGTGMRRNLEWQALQALKDIQRLAHQAQSQNQTKLNYTNNAELILYLLNHKRERITDMEKQFGLLLDLRPHGM